MATRCGCTDARQPWMTGSASAAGRSVPAASTRLSARDVLGAWGARWTIGRMRYTVAPGLYAVGSPSSQSPVLVSANYKMSFDRLRRELSGIDAWILVLDTKGINVWCAAGKGTFGTRELEKRVLAERLDQVVSHRTLILPQLGASGVSAPEVKRDAGWRVKYGPVQARDIPAFLAAGMKKTDAMRRVEFRLADRMAVAPTEIVQAWPIALAAAAASVLYALPFDGGYAARLLKALLPLLGAILAGGLAFPALLPFIPTRPFSLKGAILGIVWGAAAAAGVGASLAGGIALTLISAPIVSYMAMNYTGNSTFTCQPGAELEVRRGIIPIIVSLVLGVGLAVLARVFGI